MGMLARYDEHNSFYISPARGRLHLSRYTRIPKAWFLVLSLSLLLHDCIWNGPEHTHYRGTRCGPAIIVSAFVPSNLNPIPIHANRKDVIHPTHRERGFIFPSTSSNILRPCRSKQLFSTTLAVGKDPNLSPEESDRPLQEFEQILSERNVDDAVSERICSLLNDAGFSSTSELVLFATDFEQSRSPESLSKTLQNDFGFSAYLSHICRAALFDLVRRERENPTSTKANDTASDRSKEDDTAASRTESPSLSNMVAGGFDTAPSAPSNEGSSSKSNANGKKDVTYWSFVVNGKQQQRLQADYQYALPKNYEQMFPKLAKEIEEDFLTFMTQPAASSQEPPIREATAVVYQRHARQFAGWFLKHAENTAEIDMDALRSAYAMKEGGGELDGNSSKLLKSFSLHDIIPNKEAKSAQPIVEYIIWLRKVRSISNNYEANLLRGLTKLLKFRFMKESTADPTYGGEKSFHDIAAVRELRRLQRDASRRQTKSSERSSDEKRKWLSWKEYLGVVEALKKEVADELEQLVRDREEGRSSGGLPPSSIGRRIAKKYQRYLLLAFFSSLPDRQRTMRELEIGRTFFRNDDNTWEVKHGREDYKTGNTYGDRPPLGLSAALTSAIDDYLKYWRPYLKPSSDHFFVGPQTGKPLTVESVRYLVGKACFDHTGKKTNPHLLRDMIVTHVRDSPDVSERDLEALALFMGHSVSMQKSSYDRRTLDQKVAPAVSLLQNINSM